MRDIHTEGRKYLTTQLFNLVCKHTADHLKDGVVTKAYKRDLMRTFIGQWKDVNANEKMYDGKEDRWLDNGKLEDFAGVFAFGLIKQTYSCCKSWEWIANKGAEMIHELCTVLINNQDKFPFTVYCSHHAALVHHEAAAAEEVINQ